MSECSIKRSIDHSLAEVKAKEFVYTWKIKNFKSLHPGVGKYITSIKNSDNGPGAWTIQLYPDGCSAIDASYLGINVSFDMQSKQIKYPIYLLIVFIVDKNGNEHEFSRDFINNVCIRQLVKRQILFEDTGYLLPNGNLTLRFKTFFTSEVISKYGHKSKFKLARNIYHVYSKTKLNFFIDLIRKNFTYFTNDVLYVPRLGSILESKLNVMESMFNNQNFSDVKIVARGNEFYVYKGFLATQSPVFAAMFQHNMQENNENVVCIPDFDQEVVHKMLQFIYTGVVSNLDRTAWDLLAIAEKYELEPLKIVCEETLINDLNINTVSSLLIHADKYRAHTLKEAALEFFVYNVREVIRTHTYKADLHNLLPLMPEILENVVM